MTEQALPLQQFRAMGCDISVVLSMPSGAQAQALLAQVPAWFTHWERIFSRFRADSELSRVNAQAGQPVAVSAELLTVVQKAMNVAEQTQGLLTPLIGQAVLAIGYDRDFAQLHSCERTPLVTSETTHQTTNQATPAHAVADFRQIQCDHERLQLCIPAGSRLDLGGFVKGWCADETVRRLGRFAPALMDAGGDIAVSAAMSGALNHAQAWPIAIARPWPETEDLALIGVMRGGVATSGREYRRGVRDGQVQHHIIDPRRAQAAQTDIVSVSVSAASAFEAEVAAKHLLILGSESAQAWMQNQSDMGVCMVLVHGQTLMNDVFEQQMVH